MSPLAYEPLENDHIIRIEQQRKNLSKRSNLAKSHHVQLQGFSKVHLTKRQIDIVLKRRNYNRERSALIAYAHICNVIAYLGGKLALFVIQI